MRDFYPKLVFVAAAAFALSGCGTINSIFGAHSARMPELRMSAPANAEAAVAQATQEGRAHLDKGETGLAIEAFQRALAVGAPSAPALNGMGVAFARLGRYELAHRYFEEAKALDPSNDRYAANLARLNLSPAFAMRYNGDFAAALTGTGRNQPAAAAALAASEEAGRLTRVSSREYKVQTVAPMAAPLVRTASSTPDFKPLVRIEFSKPAAFRANAPARTAVSNPHVGKTAALDTGFRPVVRFPLRKADRTGSGD